MEMRDTVSLIWPTTSSMERYKHAVRLTEQCAGDLGIERIVQELCINQKYFETIKKWLLNLCDDPSVIRYRLDIMEDFSRLPELADECEKLLPLLHKLDVLHESKTLSGAEPLRKIAWQLEALEGYVRCVSGLKAVSERFGGMVRSNGLRRLFESVDRLTEDETFRSLAASVPDYRQKLQNMSSITLGVNLDHELKPAEAIILSMESKPFKNKKRSVLTSLLGMKTVDEPYDGVSPFQPIGKLSHPALDTALLQSLDAIFTDALQPIGHAIKRYIDVNVPAITGLEPEIGFYVGAVKFAALLASVGMPVCKPEIAPAEDRICRIGNMYDIMLAIGLTRRHPGIDLSNTIVPSDADFGDRGRIFILTGPNQGGKTTYTRAVGICQVLFQAGVFVPGTDARISPVDGLFAHFSEEEKPNILSGRLAEESRRLAEIFAGATRHSLILLNESLSSTSSRDSLHLAKDVVKGMRVLGCRAVYATHLLELAAGADAVNAEVPGDSLLISMVAGVERETAEEIAASSAAKRTYKIKPGPPNEVSYAKDIARLHGISFEQIIDTLKLRNVIRQRSDV
ncbi:MutS-related protein [Paenibacillus sp. GYB003]|uniref:MutS-related protein n=1 Tax=Paenibacillus sp. GYB003 TaxID=2994392 RepID=UPI002F9689FE